jgi:diacylglycerol O-acyltransferase
VQQLSFIDSAFLMQESPRTPNHLCMLGLYDPSTAPNGKPSYEQILEKVEACLPVAPSLRRKLVRVPLGFDRPYWVEDPDFDVEFHVRQLALPRPGDWRQLCGQVARLHARPIDLNRPPWEMTVIEGLDSIEGLPKGCFGTVLKVHHSAIDGVSGVELLSAIHDLEADPEPGSMGDGWQPERLPSTPWLLRRAAVHAASNPVNAARLVVTSLPPLAGELVGKLRNRSPGLRVPRTRFNQKISAHRVFDEARCSLDDLKRVKAAVPGATVNDACLSIIGGAMRLYLDSLGELPEQSLVTLVPVSTRTPENAGQGGNQVSMMRVSMHTDMADPLARLAAIRDTTVEKKAAQRGLAVPVLLDVAQALPGALIGAAVRAMATFGDRGPVLANTIVTNVPGSAVPLYFLGAKMVRSTGCVPLVDGVGLFHCVSSYCGTFTFMVTACRDLLPDPEPYIACLRQSIDEHLRGAGGPHTRSRVPRAHPRATGGARARAAAS